MCVLCQHICAYWSLWCEWKYIWLICVCCRVLGAMANASPDLDNAEAQRQLNNNNRPIGSGFWETECTSSKLFECSRIKALAGQKFNPRIHTLQTQVSLFASHSSHSCHSSRGSCFSLPLTFDVKLILLFFSQMNEMQCRRRLLPSGLTPICPECPVAYLTFTMTWGMDTCSPDYWRSSVESCWWEHTHRHPVVNYNWLYISFVVSLSYRMWSFYGAFCSLPECQ